MHEFLDFLTIDKGTLIGNLLNTLILFLILRHFLFGRVNKVLEERKNHIKEAYDDADKAKESALALEADYTKKLTAAKQADKVYSSFQQLQKTVYY